jgi:hypothetical protein
MQSGKSARNPRSGWGRASAAAVAVFLSSVAVLAVVSLGAWGAPAGVSQPLGDLFRPDVLTLDAAPPSGGNVANRGTPASAPADGDQEPEISVKDWTQTSLSRFH